MVMKGKKKTWLYIDVKELQKLQSAEFMITPGPDEI